MSMNSKSIAETIKERRSIRNLKKPENLTKEKIDETYKEVSEYIESKINNEKASVTEKEKWVRIKNNVVKAEKNQGNEIVEITE